LVVSSDYPKEPDGKNRQKGKHEQWGEIKSRILLELMKGSDTRSGLKLKLNEQFKKEGHKRITIKTIVYHLRDPKKNGLIDMGIVKEKNGLLHLSLTNPKKIATFIDELSKSKTVGPRVSYFIDRAFAEAFLSPFGDRFINNFRISELTDKRINDNLNSPELENMNQKRAFFALLQQRMDPPGVPQFSIEHPNSLPSYVDRNEIKGNTKERIMGIANKVNLLSIIIEAAKEIRGEIDTLFKVYYTLNVLNKANLIHKAQSDGSIRDLINILDLTMFHLPNWLIKESEIKDEIIEEFKKLMFKAVKGRFYEDRSFNSKYAILGLNKKSIFLSKKESTLSDEISSTLSDPLFREKPPDLIEKAIFWRKRAERGFTNIIFPMY